MEGMKYSQHNQTRYITRDCGFQKGFLSHGNSKFTSFPISFSPLKTIPELQIRNNIKHRSKILIYMPCSW